MKIKFNKNNFLHLIQDNGCCTLHFFMICSHLSKIYINNNILYGEIATNFATILEKHNGDLRPLDSPDDNRHGLYIKNKKNQSLFLDEAIAYIMALKMSYMGDK